MIRTVIIFSYIANEGLPILENLASSVPDQLKTMLKQFK